MKKDRDTSGVYGKWINTMGYPHCISYEELNKLIEYCGEDGMNFLMRKLIKVKEELDDGPLGIYLLIKHKKDSELDLKEEISSLKKSLKEEISILNELEI